MNSALRALDLVSKGERIYWRGTRDIIASGARLVRVKGGDDKRLYKR